MFIQIEILDLFDSSGSNVEMVDHQYVLAVDIGGTLICAEICNQHGECIVRSSHKVCFMCLCASECT